MTGSTSEPVTISRLLEAVYPSFALLAGMELDLFTPLKDGPLSLETIAGAVDVAPNKLQPLLYALVVAGLLTVDDGQFANTSEADTYLVRGNPGYLGALHGLTAENWSRVLKTAKTMRAGKPLEEHNYAEQAPEEQIALFRGLNHGAVADAQRLAELYDFSAVTTLLDVGGGSGGLAIAMVQAHPGLEATVLDFPSVTPITRQFVIEAGVADRVQVVDGDAVKARLSGAYDAAVLRHVIQVLSDEEARALLRNLANVIRPGGAVHVIGWVLDDSRISPASIVGQNLVLLTAYRHGQAYTEREYRNWLAEAGFENAKRVVQLVGASIITAWKPA